MWRLPRVQDYMVGVYILLLLDPTAHHLGLLQGGDETLPQSHGHPVHDDHDAVGPQHVHELVSHSRILI